MKEIRSYEEWNGIVEQQKQLLLFIKINGCSVCEGLYPQVDALETSYPFPFYYANVSDVPELAGQLSLFTAPVVLLFHEGKELTRFARFVPIDSLRKRLDELIEWGHEGV